MKTTHRIFAVVSLTLAALAPAAESRLQLTLRGIRILAEAGAYDHAFRAYNNAFPDGSDDFEVLELQRHLQAVAARSPGSSGPLLAATVRVPAIRNRRAEPGKNFTVETAGIAMLWVAPGSLLLSNPQGSDDDTWVTLSRGYWLGRTEVTQEQVQAVMDHLPPQSFFRGSDRPVERISWVSAMEFSSRVTERERAGGRLPAGYEYTLPTEAQWEYACRAGTTGPYAGDLAALAWFEANSDGQTHPVAQKQPNAWGFYDMHGNVSEWCVDGFHGYPGGRVTDLMIGYDGPSAAMARMVRGGAAASSAGQCRSALRYQYAMNYAGSGVGFRLALAPARKAVPPAAKAPGD